MPLFGAAFQMMFIFHDTIYENIRFGRDVSKKEAMAAAQDAQAVEFIEERTCMLCLPSGEWIFQADKSSVF